MPEITTITSESLQAEVRRLLPSQRGFGSDLEAQNVIVPIVDLTPTAEGSALRQDLQTASSFGNCVAVNRTTAGTSNVFTSPGFYKYDAMLSVLSTGTAGANFVFVELEQGGGIVPLHFLTNNSDGNPEEPQIVSVSGTVFLQTGDTFRVRTGGSDGFVSLTSWPIADVNGNFINPDGFSFE